MASGLFLRRGREESTGTSKPNVVETNVSQNAGSKASLALGGFVRECVFITAVPITKLFAWGGGGETMEDMCYER
jgi:hypothetical protein